jgi:ribose transport system permease protein
MNVDATERAAGKTDFGMSAGQRYGALAFMLLMYAANCVFTRNFFSQNTVWLLVIQACPIILAGLGMTFVIASGGIDISVGAIMALSGTILAQLMVKQQLPLGYCVAAALVAAGVVGAFNGFIITKFQVQPIVITLITMLVARGVAQVITNGAPIPFSKYPINALVSFRFWRRGMPMQVVVLLVTVLVVWFILRHTVFGNNVQSIGDNRKAAGLAGIDTFRSTMTVYIICGLCVGLASVIEVGRESQAEAAKMGLNLEMNAIAAVAIGGTPMNGGKARVLGTVIGALVMQMVGMTVNMNGILSSWGMVLKAAILILAIYFQNYSVAKS